MCDILCCLMENTNINLKISKEIGPQSISDSLQSLIFKEWLLCFLQVKEWYKQSWKQLQKEEPHVFSTHTIVWFKNLFTCSLSMVLWLKGGWLEVQQTWRKEFFCSLFGLCVGVSDKLARNR